MRALLIVLALLVGCKGKNKQEPATGSGSGSGSKIVPIDWAKCDAALDKAAGAPLASRPAIVIEGCQACGGDWKPILQWQVDPATGGPKREQIEAMLVACDTFCTGDSKQKFIAGVDKARGQGVNTPWRQLAAACKDKVNGSPDERFMSAPFFALDRIARAAAAKGGPTADKLAALELPLPAVTVSGAGVMLPDAENVAPKTGDLQITVLGAEMYVGRMPRAKLGATGVVAHLGDKGYPGEKVEPDKLGAKVKELVGADKTQTITILAPHGLPAANLVPVIAAASPLAPVYLAANAYESPEGWQLAGTLPIALEVGDQIKLAEGMTVQNLARELAAHVARKLDRVGVTKP